MTKPKLAQPWNMASVRSRTTPRVYKTCGPVLGQIGHSRGLCRCTDTPACKGCGYHVCSCERHHPVIEAIMQRAKVTYESALAGHVCEHCTRCAACVVCVGCGCKQAEAFGGLRDQLNAQLRDKLHAEALLEDKQRAQRGASCRPPNSHVFEAPGGGSMCQCGMRDRAKPDPFSVDVNRELEALTHVSLRKPEPREYGGPLEAQARQPDDSLRPAIGREYQMPAMTLEAARHHLKQEAALHRAMQDGELYLAAVEAGLQRSTVQETIDSINKLTWPDIYK